MRLTFRDIGGDGLLTLLLSNLVIALTGGFFWLWQLRAAHRIAAAASADPSADRAMVLGVRLSNNRIGSDFRLRLERAKTLYRHGKTDGILILGGLTGKSDISEAQAGRLYLLSQGVPPDSIRTEDASKHTLENLRQARALLTAEQGEEVALITNRYHLARAHAMAEGLSIPHRLCAAEDTFSLDAGVVMKLIREAYYLHWYFTGKYWSLLTGNRKSLARIS